MTIKETLWITIVAHVIIILAPKIYDFFKRLSMDNVELYQAIKGNKK